MRRLGLVLAFGVLVVGTSAQAQAQAQVTASGSAGSTVYYNAFSDPGTALGPNAGTDFNSGAGGGTDYNSYVDIGREFVTFESSNTVAGPYVKTESYSTVAIGLHNTTGQDVHFESTITPAGLGFYLADTSAEGCLYSGCAPVSLGGLSLGNLGGTEDLSLLAEVGFDFSISRRGAAGELETLYSLSGTLGLNSDGFIDALGYAGDLDLPATGARSLFDFTEQNYSATNIGYTWGATPVELDIGNAVDQTLIYTTRVTSMSNGGCILETSFCLVAYSGFGDPVGRGGGVSAFARGITSMSGATGVTFGPSTFEFPTFEDGVLSFRAAGGGAVPEPATWMAMILGFGLLGTALRRRRALAFT
jgi:hypothetical protein